jgi:HEPN domain-containing protein
MNAPPEARRIFAMACKDFLALQAMEDATAFADEIVGFHAQQAIEKALKTWISAPGGEYPRTHDLGRLMQALESLDAGIEPFRDLAAYSSFSVQFRYEAFGDLNEEPLDRARVVNDVFALFQRVEAVLQT